MENHQFWAFFVIALIAGGAITLAISNATITGAQFWERFRIAPPTPKTCAQAGGVICSPEGCVNQIEGVSVPIGKVCCERCQAITPPVTGCGACVCAEIKELEQLRWLLTELIGTYENCLNYLSVKNCDELFGPRMIQEPFVPEDPLAPFPWDLLSRVYD